MNWPKWNRGETRADASQLAIQQLEAAAAGRVAQPERLAVCRAVAGLYASALSGASFEGVNLSADWLGLAVRTLLFRGESLHLLDMRGGNVTLLPAAGWDITGAAEPSSWRYRLDLSGPSGSTVRNVGRDGVAHLQFDTTAIEPWRGIGPWHQSDTLKALWLLELAVAAEGSTPHARVSSVPKTMPAQVRASIQSALSRATGGAVLLDSARDYGAQMEGGRWERLGFAAPESLVGLRRQLEESVAAAAGVPGELLYVSPGGGSGAREAFRRWYHVSVKPLATRIETELSRVLERPVTLSLRDLGAADIAGRARAAGSLVTAGADFEQAMRIVGIDDAG